MFIRVLSRYMMRQIKETSNRLLDDYKIISLCDPVNGAQYSNVGSNDYGPLFEPNPNVLTLEFNDIIFMNDDQTEIHNPPPGFVLFNKDHAKRIIEFLLKMNKDEDLIVHCFMGVSRSGAVSTFARELFGCDYDKFRKANPLICPNQHMLKVLDSTFKEMYGTSHSGYKA